MDTIKIVLAIAAKKTWPIYQMYVKYAFLNGYLEEEVYVGQPQGYEFLGQEHKMYMIKKGTLWFQASS